MAKGTMLVEKQLLDEAVLSINDDGVLLELAEGRSGQSSSHSDEALVIHQWCECSQPAGRGYAMLLQEGLGLFRKGPLLRSAQQPVFSIL